MLEGITITYKMKLILYLNKYKETLRKKAAYS